MKAENKILIVFSILVYCIAMNTILTERLSMVCEIEKHDNSESIICFNVFGEYESSINYDTGPVGKVVMTGETYDEGMKTCGIIIMTSWIIGVLSAFLYLLIKERLYSKIQILLVAAIFISSIVATVGLIISLNAMHNLYENYRSRFHDKGYWAMIILMLTTALLSGLSLIEELKITNREFIPEEERKEIEKKIMQEKAMQKRRKDELTMLNR